MTFVSDIPHATAPKPWQYKEAVWMESGEYQVRRHGNNLSFWEKKSPGPVRIGTLMTLAGALLIAAWVVDRMGYENYLDIPAQYLPVLAAFFGGLGLLVLALIKLIRKSPQFLIIDAHGKRIIDTRTNRTYPFERAEVHIRHDKTRTPVYVGSKSDFTYLYKIHYDNESSYLYQAFWDSHHERLKAYLEDVGIEVKTISQFD